ncbi:PP2C family protein-serine/threonine phosphatase [Kitasatospora sp. NPDC058478]|uniref:PP2C family protein-serine/threonine phosphatase n=1 Tax=unclassified Kitasatospora TaxID=2633591 RepID=UPI0036574914
MPNSTFALAVDPDGTQDEMFQPSYGVEQLELLSRNLGAGYSSLPIGGYTVHCGTRSNAEEANRYGQQMWTRLAGGGRAPFFRGAVWITGRRRPDGTYLPLDRVDLDRLSEAANSRQWARPGGLVISGAQLQGQRDKQCDALAVHRDRASGVWSFVVCDGVGDTEATAAFVQHVTPRLARVASRTGSPGDAIRTVRAELPDWHRRSGLEGEPTSTAVAATWHPDWDEVRIAWSGDSRAYVFSPSGRREQATADHNLAAVKLRCGKPLHRWDHNLLLSDVGYGDIGERTVHRDAVDTLLLCTDGAYHPLDKDGSVRTAIDWYAYVTLEHSLIKSTAGELVSDAVERAVSDFRKGSGELADNASALMVALPAR